MKLNLLAAKPMVVMTVYVLLPLLGASFALWLSITKPQGFLLVTWFIACLSIILLLAAATHHWRRYSTLRLLEKTLNDPLYVGHRIDHIKLSIQQQISLGSAIGSVVYGGAVLIFVLVATIVFWMFEAHCSGSIGPGEDLRNCYYEGQDLSEKDLRGANLSGAVLKNAILQRTDLSEANLVGANLEAADLTGATLQGAVLDDVNLQGAIGLTDDILARALKVTSATLAGTLSQKRIRLESRDNILRSLGGVCLRKGIVEAGAYIPDQSFHALVLLGSQGSVHRFTDRIPDEWQPMAIRFAELVLCVEEEREVLVESCSYFGGPSIKRYRYDTHVQLFSARTADVVFEHIVKGSTPDSCPAAAPTAQTQIEGERVGYDDLVSRLALVNYVNPVHLK